MKKRKRTIMIIGLVLTCLMGFWGLTSAYEPRNIIGYFGESQYNQPAELSGYPAEMVDEIVGYGVELGKPLNRHVVIAAKAGRLTGRAYGKWTWGIPQIDFDMDIIPVSVNVCATLGRPNRSHIGVLFGLGGVSETITFAPGRSVHGFGSLIEFGGELGFNLGQWSPNQWTILYLQAFQRNMRIPKLGYSTDIDIDGDGVVDYAKGDEFIYPAYTSDGLAYKLGIRVVF